MNEEWDRKNVEMMIDQIKTREETPVVQSMPRPVAKRRRRN